MSQTCDRCGWVGRTEAVKITIWAGPQADFCQLKACPLCREHVLLAIRKACEPLPQPVSQP